jgi:anti-sigma factor RsiW
MRANGNCAKARDLLEHYYEDVLPRRQGEMVADHLRRCPACRAELAQIRRVAALLEGLPAAEPGADLLRSISHAVAAAPSPVELRREFAGWRRLGLLTACATAALALLNYAVRPLIQQHTYLPHPVYAFGHKLAALVSAMGGSLLDAARALLPAAESLLSALWFSLPRVSPAVAVYVAAEVAIIFAAVVLMRRRPRPVRVPFGIFA